MRAESHIAKETYGYVNQCTYPCRIAHNAIQLVQTLVVDAVEDFKELPAIKRVFVTKIVRLNLKSAYIWQDNAMLKMGRHCSTPAGSQ